MNNFILKARVITLGSAVALLPFSVRFCHMFLLLFMIACLCEGNFVQRARIIKQNPLAWMLPAFFLLYVLSVFYSDNESDAWRNVDKKLAFFFAPLVIVSSTPFTKEEIRKLMWVFVAACLVGTLVCIYDVIFVAKAYRWNLGPEAPYLALHPDAPGWWPYVSYIHLASGIGMRPTYLSLYLLVCILIILRTVEKRWLSTMLVVYLVIFIVFLSSRIVVLATIVTVAFTLKKKVLIGAISAMIVAILINPIALYRNAQEYTHSNFTIPPASFNDNPINIRTSLLWLSAKAIQETNPLFGTGAGDVEDTIRALADKHDVHNVLETSDPHNQYLHTYIALGTVGLLTLLAVFAAPLLILYRQKEFLACAGLIAFMVVCMTESALELQKGIVLFTMFVCLTGNQVREWRFTTQRLKYA